MLVDTSIWVEHLRHGQLGLVSLLHRAEVHCHPFIIGELACGSISHRSEILQLLRRLPSVPVVENEEVMTFVERHRLMGRGVGWVRTVESGSQFSFWRRLPQKRESGNFVHAAASAAFCSNNPTNSSLQTFQNRPLLKFRQWASLFSTAIGECEGRKQIQRKRTTQRKSPARPKRQSH